MESDEVVTRPSLAELIAPVARDHLGALGTAGAVARIAEAARPWPPLSGAILERRLAEVGADVDLSVRVQAGHGEREALGRVPAPSPARARVADLQRRWADPGTALHRAVDVVWLEMDALHPDAAARPSVFFDVAEPREAGWIADEALPALLGAPLPSRLRAELERHLDALPAGAGLPFVGVMLSREPSTIRLTVALERRELPGYLAAIGFAGPRDVELPVAASERVVAHVELGERPGETLGLELRPREREGWPALLEELAAEGLCAEAERDALLAWPGTGGVEPGPWPSLRAPEDPRRVAEWTCVRRLSHVKRVLAPGTAARAKAYLFAGFGWP